MQFSKILTDWKIWGLDYNLLANIVRESIIKKLCKIEIHDFTFDKNFISDFCGKMLFTKHFFRQYYSTKIDLDQNKNKSWSCLSSFQNE